MNKVAADIAEILGNAYHNKQATDPSVMSTIMEKLKGIGNTMRDPIVQTPAAVKGIGSQILSNPTVSGAVAGGAAGLLTGNGIKDRLRRAAGGAAVGGAMGYGGRMAYQSLNKAAPPVTPKGDFSYPGGAIDPSKMTDALHTKDFQDYKNDPGPSWAQRGIKGGVRFGYDKGKDLAEAAPGTTIGAGVGILNAGLSPKVKSTVLGDPRNLVEGANAMQSHGDATISDNAKNVLNMGEKGQNSLARNLQERELRKTRNIFDTGKEALKQWRGNHTMEAGKPALMGTAGKSVSINAAEQFADKGRNALHAAGSAGAAAGVAGVKAPKVTAAPQLYRGFLTRGIRPGGQMGRALGPMAMGAGYDIYRSLTAPNTSPEQQARLENIKKIVGK